MNNKIEYKAILSFLLAIWCLFSPQQAFGQWDKLKKKVQEKTSDVLGGENEERVEKLITKFEKGQPISTTFDDAVYEADFLGDFEPNESEYRPLDIQPKAENSGYRLKTGLYTMNAKSFCLRGYTHGPSKGDGHLYAPLKGKKADFVKSIIEHYAAKPEIPQRNVQVLLWAIIAGADMNTLGEQHSKTLNALFTTEELLEMTAKGWAEGYAQKQFDELKRAIVGKTPAKLQELLDADEKMRNMVKENKSFQEIEKIAIIAGLAPRDMIREVSKGRWSYHPDGFFVRFFPNGYPQTRVDVYVPYKDAIQKDATGKAIGVNKEANQLMEVVFNPSGMVASPANRPSQRIGISPVPVNPSPQPPIDEKEYGTTVITHGFVLGGSTNYEEDWMFSMARAIVNKFGGEVLRYNINSGDFDPHYSNGVGERVLIFDWSLESNFEGSGFSEAAGDALFAALMRNGYTQKLHFIGHSRGTVVNTECVLRLLSVGVPVDHVTNLDPHDWGAGVLGYGFGYDNDNHPELGKISFPSTLQQSRPGVISWQNVGYIETYYQSGGLEITSCGSLIANHLQGLEGRPVEGSFNAIWNYYGQTKLCHTNIHECAYIKSVENPAINIDGGYKYSRLGGHKALRKSYSDSRKPAGSSFSFFDRLTLPNANINRIKGIMNGSFDRGSDDDIPGWSKIHGGGGNAQISDENLLFKEKLLFKNKQWRKHNFFYLPIGVKSIKMSFRNYIKCPNSSFEVAFSIGKEEQVVFTRSLTEVNISDIQFAIDVTKVQGQVITLELRTLGDCNDQQVVIDDIEFSKN